MASAQDADEREDYVVRVVEFPGDTSAVIGALQRVFGLSEPEARAILSEVPVDVRRGINRIRADYFRRALELSGARVEVLDAAGERVTPGGPQLTAAKPVPQQPVAPPTAATTRQAAEAASVENAVRPLSATIAGAGPWQAGAGAAPRAETPAAQGRHALDREAWSKGAPGAPAATTPNAGADRSTAAFGKTLVLGSVPAPMQPGPPPANEVRTSPQPAPRTPRMSGEATPEAAAAFGGWGDFQPFKEPVAPAAAPPARSVEQAPARQNPLPVIGGPRELSTSDMPGGSDLQAGARLELSFSGPPKSAAGEGRKAHGPTELGNSDLPAGPPLELGVEESGMRESKPRYDAIPAGERWKAPGADTLARARRKHMVESLESGLADPRPSPLPPGATPPTPPRRLSDRPKPRAAPAATPLQRTPKQQVQLGFWEVARLAVAGSATTWTLWILAASSATGAAIELYQRIPAAGAPLALACLAVLIAVCGAYHRKAFWSAATGETEIDESPSSELPGLLRGGLPLSLFAAITQTLLWIWLFHQLREDRSALAVVTSPALWVLGFGPGFYWPIALGTSAAHNRPGRVWDLARGLRALGREPGEIARVALAGGSIFVASLALVSVVLSAIGLDGALGLFVAAGVPLALSHALMGAWTGRVLYARPDVFE